MPTFGELLKAAREAARLTQQQLAAKAGLSQAAISKAELAATVEDAGRRDTVDRIANALGTSVDALLAPARPRGRPLLPDEQAAFEDAIEQEAVTRALASGGADDDELRAATHEELRRQTAELKAKGYVAMRGQSNESCYDYIVDVLGRNFNHQAHRLSDSHALLEFFAEFHESRGHDLTISNHFSPEIDIGFRLMLDAAAAMRQYRQPINVQNILIEMAIRAGAAVINAARDPAAANIPAPRTRSDDEIPF